MVLLVQGASLSHSGALHFPDSLLDQGTRFEYGSFQSVGALFDEDSLGLLWCCSLLTVRFRMLVLSGWLTRSSAVAFLVLGSFNRYGTLGLVGSIACNGALKERDSLTASVLYSWWLAPTKMVLSQSMACYDNMVHYPGMARSDN
jgi:hypothetical protein